MFNQQQHTTGGNGASAPAVFEQLRQHLDWRVNLLLTPTKTPRAILANALIALREAPEWQGVLAYDEFALITKLMRAPPWFEPHRSWTPQQWTDRDDVLTANWLQHREITVNEKVAATAVETVAKDAAFHPIKDYLNGLKWDGRKRYRKLCVQLSRCRSEALPPGRQPLSIYCRHCTRHVAGLQGRLRSNP